MPNSYGTPIWYELMTADPAKAAAFYGAVCGWTVGEAPAGGPDYRMIAAPDGNVGGVMTLSPEMVAGGAKPGWFFYVGVEDVDAAAARATELGATMFVPPTDIPDVGRFAFLADPQGAPLYVMRGNSDEASTAFAPGTPGHISWNELWTTDRPGALDFYAALFGWENPETMDMGAMGGYHFVHAGETRLGAIAGSMDPQPRWTLYVEVADFDRAVATVAEQGGRIDQGPHQVPTGDRIVIGADPEGARFALVGK